MSIEKIWLEYQKRIKAYLNSRVSDPNDAEELLQEVFIRTYQNLGNLKSQDKAKSWIFQITSNVISDFYRKNKSTWMMAFLRCSRSR